MTDANPNARMICLTHMKTSGAEILRNYETQAADQENYDCTTLGAGSAAAVAPLILEEVTFQSLWTER